MATDCAVDPKVKYADLLKPANKRVIQESIPLKTVEYSNGIPRISWTEEEVDKMNVIEGLQFAVIVGKPIQLDMAIINRTRLSYAKVKVQLDLTVKLPNYVELEVINRRTQINKVQKVDELEDGEVPADTPDDLNNDKHEHHKEVIRQEHKELDFSEGTIDKKLPVENITTNALMGREDPQYIKVSYNKNNTDMPQAHTETPGKTNWRNKGVEKDNHNSSHEVIQEGMSNVEDSQSTPAIEIENKKDVMIVKHQDDEVSHELVVPLQIDTSCIRDFQGLQEGTSPDTGYGGRGQHRGQVEDFEEADNQTNMTQALIDAGLPDTSTTRGRNKVENKPIRVNPKRGILSCNYLYNYKYQETGQSFITTFVYEKCDEQERRGLWEDIHNLNINMNLPWLVGGDFNVIFNDEEKIGGLLVHSHGGMEEQIEITYSKDWTCCCSIKLA
ncbi:hypothetical protein KY285_025439 [Solanum tuberosum]|nr:hypothetical protein KY285_025439 [Solanum tuberosum]